jgi:hypothetical protein
MINGIPCAPTPRNEPVLSYVPGSPERAALRAELNRMATEVIEITPRIGGERIATGRGSSHGCASKSPRCGWATSPISPISWAP